MCSTSRGSSITAGNCIEEMRCRSEIGMTHQHEPYGLAVPRWLGIRARRPHLPIPERGMQLRIFQLPSIYVLRRASLPSFFEYRRMTLSAKTDIGPLFGKRLREARELAGIPQDKLGVLIGLDESSSSARISRYETGVHEPPVRTAKRLAVALKVPLAFLYCDDEVLAKILLLAHRMSKEARKALLGSMQ